MVFIPSFAAIAGGLDVPFAEESVADIENPANKLDTEAKSTELSSTKAIESQKRAGTTTVLPTTFDWDSWTKTADANGITCQTDGFNIVCLDQNQAKALYW
ncbi:MAG: hypothetical protein HC799_11320 [Limnothrix sp. RL_2_0]|nr:hypothetical protein [Limnothrix sp. RL_2_0]